MDFGIYPPEINSGRMYAGPGSGPMLAAAVAWDELASELQVAAASYQSVIADLGGSWSGPSSVSMAAAGLPYAAWLQTTAAQAEETAMQAKAAVSAYEAAFAATVPPPVIAANRSLLMTLVATNFFGQNTPAIAATEAQYAEMWAQDATAMYGYAGSSASARKLTPFTDAPKTANPGASADQAAGTWAGNAQNTVSTVPQTLSAAPNALPAAPNALPADPPSLVTALTTLNDLITIFLTAPSDLSVLFDTAPFAVVVLPDLFPTIIIDTSTALHTDHIVSGWNGEQDWPSTAPTTPTEFRAIITNPGPLAPATTSGWLGTANAVGGLSVPSAWTVAAPEIRTAALTLPALSALPATPVSPAAMVEAGSRTMFSEMALGGMTGVAVGGTPGAAGGDATGGKREAGRPGRTAIAPDRAATDGKSEGAPGEPRIVVTGIAARLREMARLRDEGSLTDEEYTEQKARLLGD